MGQRQRVRLARCSRARGLVLLDEPLTSLDDEAAERLAAASASAPRAGPCSGAPRRGTTSGSRSRTHESRGAACGPCERRHLRVRGGGTFLRDLRVYLSYPGRFPMRVLTALFSLALFHYISQLVAVDRFPTRRTTSRSSSWAW